MALQAKTAMSKKRRSSEISDDMELDENEDEEYLPDQADWYDEEYQPDECDQEDEDEDSNYYEDSAPLSALKVDNIKMNGKKAANSVVEEKTQDNYITLTIMMGSTLLYPKHPLRDSTYEVCINEDASLQDLEITAQKSRSLSDPWNKFCNHHFEKCLRFKVGHGKTIQLRESKWNASDFQKSLKRRLLFQELKYDDIPCDKCNIQEEMNLNKMNGGSKAKSSKDWKAFRANKQQMQENDINLLLSSTNKRKFESPILFSGKDAAKDIDENGKIMQEVPASKLIQNIRSQLKSAKQRKNKVVDKHAETIESLQKRITTLEDRNLKLTKQLAKQYHHHHNHHRRVSYRRHKRDTTDSSSSCDSSSASRSRSRSRSRTKSRSKELAPTKKKMMVSTKVTTKAVSPVQEETHKNDKV